MPELTLHFEADSRADRAQLARELEAVTATLPGVEGSEARPEKVQTGIGPSEIMLALTMGTMLLVNASKAVGAAADLVASVKRFATELGLRNGRVEIGLRQVPLENLSPDDLREWSGE